MLEDFEEGRKNDWLPPDPKVYWFWDLYGLSLPYPGQGALGVNYYKPKPDQFIGFELTVDCDFSTSSRLKMWVFGEVTMQMALEDQASSEVALDLDRALNPRGWTLLEFAYASVRDEIDLDAIKTVKIFIAPDDPNAQGRIVLDDIMLVP